MFVRRSGLSGELIPCSSNPMVLRCRSRSLKPVIECSAVGWWLLRISRVDQKGWCAALCLVYGWNPTGSEGVSRWLLCWFLHGELQRVGMQSHCCFPVSSTSSGWNVPVGAFVCWSGQFATAFVEGCWDHARGSVPDSTLPVCWASWRCCKPRRWTGSCAWYRSQQATTLWQCCFVPTHGVWHGAWRNISVLDPDYRVIDGWQSAWKCEMPMVWNTQS